MKDEATSDTDEIRTDLFHDRLFSYHLSHLKSPGPRKTTLLKEIWGNKRFSSSKRFYIFKLKKSISS